MKKKDNKKVILEGLVILIVVVGLVFAFTRDFNETIGGEAIFVKTGETKEGGAGLYFQTGANIVGVNARTGGGLKINVKDPQTKVVNNVRIYGNGDIITPGNVCGNNGCIGNSSEGNSGLTLKNCRMVKAFSRDTYKLKMGALATAEEVYCNKDEIVIAGGATCSPKHWNITPDQIPVLMYSHKIGGSGGGPEGWGAECVNGDAEVIVTATCCKQ